MLKAFARDLKHIREEKNISLRDISVKTRLNISVLESLENADYTFQPQTYIRAFLKQYIAALDLDVDEILFDYDLARSGKYKQKFFFNDDPGKANSETESKESEKSSKHSLKEKLKEIVESPAKIIQEKKSEQKDTKKADDENSYTEIKEEKTVHAHTSKTENRLSINPNESKPVSSSIPENVKKSSSFSFLASPVVKNIFGILFIILVLIGLYSLINILFLEGSDDKPQIIRQNFDEVVQEQEKKLLGKRTPEEINDSIKKAQEQSLLTADTIVLKINSLSRGSVFVSYDSVNYSNPEKIVFEEGETGTFKATKFFHISSGNTEAFNATVNNKSLKFNKKSVSKVKINKDGIVN